MTRNKIAQVNHYQQISNVFANVRALANVVANTPGTSPAEKSVKIKVRDLLQEAYQLFYTAKTQGITASHSAAFRNNLEAKLDDLIAEVRQQEYNPYGENVYVEVENKAPALYSALQQYIPQSIAAQPTAPTTPTGPVGPQSIPQYQSALPPEKQPWEWHDPETIPAPPGSGYSRIPAVDTPDVGAAKPKSAPEEPGFSFPPGGMPGEPRLAPPFTFPNTNPYPGPGETIRRSWARQQALKKLAGR